MTKSKKCFRCNKTKPILEFYKHPQMPDGHLNKCIECTKLDNKIKNGKEKRKCIICGNKFNTTITEINRGGGNCCSRECWYHKQRKDIKKGKLSPSWKNGEYRTGAGYIKISGQYNHPRRDKNNCVYQHILIMEKYIGRYLKKSEAVHHINGIKDDNRISNLMLFPTRGSHIAFHWTIKRNI